MMYVCMYVWEVTHVTRIFLRCHNMLCCSLRRIVFIFMHLLLLSFSFSVASFLSFNFLYLSPTTITTTTTTNTQTQTPNNKMAKSPSKKSAKKGKKGRLRQAPLQAQGVLLHLHLPCPQAGAPRHWYLQEGHVDHELVHQRRLRAHRPRGRPPGTYNSRPPSRPARSRPPSASCSRASSPSTPCPRAPRPSPSTRAPKRSRLLFYATHGFNETTNSVFFFSFSIIATAFRSLASSHHTSPSYVNVHPLERNAAIKRETTSPRVHEVQV